MEHIAREARNPTYICRLIDGEEKKLLGLKDTT